MKTVNYEYDMDQKVKTPFGDDGVISMLGYDEAGNQYFVKTAKDAQWYKEKQLSPIE